MKLYIVPKNTERLNVDNVYFLISEEGECLASHICSNICFAKRDLYFDRSERIKEYTERFGEVKILNLGDDDMTADKIMDLNQKWFDNLEKKEG